MNVCYDNSIYYTLSPDVCLFVTSSESPPELEHYNSSVEWVKIRVLEVYEYLRLRWYSLTVADELLDKAIQDLEEVKKKLDSLKFNELIKEVKIFLRDWIDKKCIILRTFEDPSTQRCAGLSFNLLYKKGEECFLINELEDMVKFKLEHIDKVYTDIMDLARINSLKYKE